MNDAATNGLQTNTTARCFRSPPRVTLSRLGDQFSRAGKTRENRIKCERIANKQFERTAQVIEREGERVDYSNRSIRRIRQITD